MKGLNVGIISASRSWRFAMQMLLQQESGELLDVIFEYGWSDAMEDTQVLNAHKLDVLLLDLELAVVDLHRIADRLSEMTSTAKIIFLVNEEIPHLKPLFSGLSCAILPRIGSSNLIVSTLKGLLQRIGIPPVLASTFASRPRSTG